jgi:recombination protein RecT
MEVLMTRRSMKASFAPGAYVFPGGGVEPQDQFYGRNRRIPGIKPASNAINFVAFRTSQHEQSGIWALAAIRESFEELGMVLARDKSGAWLSQHQVDALDRSADFYPQMQAHAYQLAADNVHLLAHWKTDRDMPKRFDVPFLVARAPAGQTPKADEAEQFAPEWVSPREALQRHAAGQFFMIFPTVRTLERLQKFNAVDEVLALCASEQPLWTSCPRAGLLGGKEIRVMEHEAAYGELALVAPYGQIGHALDWQHDQPVQLLKHVMRLTAPNPSMMTGPGTNTYIVGTPETGYIVIDPGPDLSAHTERIMQATGGDIHAIVCTHSHADHSPGALPLQLRVTESSNTVPSALAFEFARHVCPILGLASAPTARDSAYFEPDITLQNHERLMQYFRRVEAENALEIDLQVIYTPGHAANHLCLISAQDGLLFSGDHILNGSTTVIDPPDGDMSAYLDALDELHALCEQHDLRFILPAHGYVLSACDARQDSSANSDTQGGAARAILALKAHRLKREAKIIAAMKQKPQANLDDLVPLAYDDVDPKLWPIAMRSLMAHVKRIQELSLA